MINFQVICIVAPEVLQYHGTIQMRGDIHDTLEISTYNLILVHVYNVGFFFFNNIRSFSYIRKLFTTSLVFFTWWFGHWNGLEILVVYVRFGCRGRVLIHFLTIVFKEILLHWKTVSIWIFPTNYTPHHLENVLANMHTEACSYMVQCQIEIVKTWGGYGEMEQNTKYKLCSFSLYYLC